MFRRLQPMLRSPRRYLAALQDAGAPTKRKRDIGEYIYNLGALTSLSSFMVTDMFALRSLQIAGGSMSLFYHATRRPPAASPSRSCAVMTSI